MKPIVTRVRSIRILTKLLRRICEPENIQAELEHQKIAFQAHAYSKRKIDSSLALRSSRPPKDYLAALRHFSDRFSETRTGLSKSSGETISKQSTDQHRRCRDQLRIKGTLYQQRNSTAYPVPEARSILKIKTIKQAAG